MRCERDFRSNLHLYFQMNFFVNIFFVFVSLVNSQNTPNGENVQRKKQDLYCSGRPAMSLKRCPHLLLGFSVSTDERNDLSRDEQRRSERTNSSGIVSGRRTRTSELEGGAGHRDALPSGKCHRKSLLEVSSFSFGTDRSKSEKSL